MINGEDSALKALLNLMNRDHKIIELREHLAINGIGIIKIDKVTMQQHIEHIRSEKNRWIRQVKENWPGVEKIRGK